MGKDFNNINIVAVHYLQNMILPSPHSCKIIIQSDVVGNIVTLVDDADETWSQLCQRTVEKDYLLSHRRLLPLLVHIHPGKRLVAYRLRYDMGHGTIIKPTWSQRANDYDGVHEVVPVGEAFVDVNVSLRQSRAAPEFEPHESIFASLGAEGVERTTFVTLHCEIIGVDGENGACPFPVTRELTRVLLCNEHERFSGCIDGYELLEEGSDEIYACSLPGKCMNICMAEDDYEVMINKTSLPNLNMDEEFGVKNAQGKRVEEDVNEDICLIEDVERNCTAVCDDINKTRRMKKRTNEALNQVSVSMGEGVEQAGVAESTIDKQTIPRGIVTSVGTGSAATGKEKTRTLKKEQPIPFQISNASRIAKKSSSAAGAIPRYSGEEAVITSALYGRLVDEDSASDFGGLATEAADKSHEKAASINNTGSAAYPSGKNDGHKAMQMTVTQLSEMEPSSEKAVTAAADVDLSLGNEKISKEPVKKTSDAKSNDGTSISRVSKFLAMRRVDSKQSQGNKKMLASQPVAAEPAIGLPPGWTTRRIQRVGSTRTDCRYFSPKLDYLLRTKKEAQRFLKFLKEANGDEEEAMLLFGPTGQGTTKSAATGGTFDNRVNNDHDVDSISKMAMETATKNKRKRKTTATKKALQDLASGKEDESSTTPLIVKHEQPSRKKSKVMTEKIAQEIKSHIKEDDKSRKKKLADPAQPKKPPSAYMLFYRSALPKLISDHPDLKPAEVVSMILI